MVLTSAPTARAAIASYESQWLSVGKQSLSRERARARRSRR